jgi:hypothetical protein
MNSTELWALNNLLDELAKRKAHPFVKYVPLSLDTNNQLAFHKSRKYIRLLLGGNRSGKSRTSSQEIMWWCTETHPYQSTPKKPRVWVISPEYRTIYEGVWSHLRDNLPEWEIKKFGPKTPGWDIPTYIEFVRGGRIDFISAQTGEDRTKLQAAEIDLAVIDEEISGSLIVEIEMRLLTRGGRLIVGATLINSEEWIVQLETSTEVPGGNPDVDLFRLDTRANIYNNQTALKRLLTKLPEEELSVRIQGLSRRTHGLIYKNFSPQRNIIDEFPIPRTWTRVMVLDPGYRLAAALWGAISPPPSKLVLYREMYLPFSEASDWVNFIYTSEGWVNTYTSVWKPGDQYEEISLRLIDPSAFSHQVDGSPGIGSRLSEDYHLDFCPGFNDKGTNIFDVRTLLMGEDPVLKVFSSLRNFIDEIRQYRTKLSRERKNLDSSPDRPLKKHDHLMNCLEYMASQKVAYLQPKTAQELLEDEANMEDDEINWPEDPTERRIRRINILRLRARMNREESLSREE